MDAADLVYMECDVQLIKVGDNKEALPFTVRESQAITPIPNSHPSVEAQAITQINHRDHCIPRHKYAFHAGV